MPPPLSQNNTVALCCNVCIIHVMHTAHTTTQQHATACANTIVCASATFFNYTESYTMQSTLHASLSADYTEAFEDMYNSDTEVDIYDIEHELITRFEREFADHLRGCDSEDVGGVVVYLRGGEEVAFFDYENFHGSVYALGHKRASETSIEWAERVGIA